VCVCVCFISCYCSNERARVLTIWIGLCVHVCVCMCVTNRLLVKSLQVVCVVVCPSLAVVTEVNTIRAHTQPHTSHTSHSITRHHTHTHTSHIHTTHTHIQAKPFAPHNPRYCLYIHGRPSKRCWNTTHRYIVCVCVCTCVCVCDVNDCV